MYFAVDASLLQYNVVELVLGGVDTIANVSINGHVVGQTSNMFKRYVLDVKEQLRVRKSQTSVFLQICSDMVICENFPTHPEAH